ncbi:glycosyl hydrolase family 61-domain-containing protein [Fusarium oxysporum Fo47]|uniref:glycosyl hydrolase family 61-domain-containing protein n=1 Tax=Fusarium oxysporum Fo47 TaxID=660027 RepID=UPI002869D52B|nr:glycosyl hydrolase family 61-domain-containing protein [Fusarium oxysporum Fo47]QKD61928.2 glycosyl hydrolase family 61-domain-containing protein [Fusarium oxysporum Fo47]
MKTTTYVSALLSLASAVSAHYTFDKLTLAGVQQGTDNEYIRKHQNGYMPTKFKNIPDGSISPTDKDFTCNKGSTPSANAFGGTGMKHPGPIQVYAAPVKDATSDSPYDLKWYKIHQALICKSGNAESLRSTAWCSWGEDSVHFKIPSTLPDGQYLIRGEHIGLHGAHDGQAEFYYACAQVEVSGNSATTIPGTSVSIPGVYKQDDAAVNFSLWGSSTSYDVMPGPDVIPGGTIRGSADGAGGDVTKTVEGGADTGSDSGSDASPTEGSAAPSSTPTSAPEPSQAPVVPDVPDSAETTPQPTPVAAETTPLPSAGNGASNGCSSGSSKARRHARHFAAHRF